MKILLSIIGILAAGFAVYWLYGNVVNSNAHSVARGTALYAENCASCHGENLEGQPDWQDPDAFGIFPAPPHNAEGHTWHHDDRLLFDYTKFGGAAAMAMRGLEGFESGMPAYEGLLSDSQINDIWAFIKSTWPEQARAAQAERTALDIEANP